jgi:hypothetical protein
MKFGFLQGSILGPLLIIYINDLQLRINSVSEPILFADDNCVIISGRNFNYFCSVTNLVLSQMIKWFAANNLVLNLDKTNIIKFITKNSAHSTLCVGCKEKYVEETVNTKFLGLQIDNHINWKIDIVQIIPKLNGAMLCY